MKGWCLILSIVWSGSLQSSNAFSVHRSSTHRPRTELFASVSRRQWLSVLATGWCLTPRLVSAEEVVEMKDFIDPQGLFTIRIPKSYFALRRTGKGDLPDPKTGTGRRGSSIFTAGDMQKAEVVAIERFPTRTLLEENGIEATGKLATFPDLGEPSAIAGLLNLRRERDKATSNTALVPNSLLVTEDGKELYFQLKTEIDVQKPELLMEQYGVSELFRITTAKASLKSGDGNLMVVYASALDQDFRGPDGVALQQAVNSFQALEQPSMVS